MYGINDSGQVAGYGYNGSTTQAFIGTTSGSTAIPLPAGAITADVAYGSINGSGDVVGYSDAGGWIWDATDGTELLNAVVPTGWNIDSAISISDSGLILAQASYNGGPTQYVELSPNVSATPEPGTILLACAGLLLIALWGQGFRPASSVSRS